MIPIIIQISNVGCEIDERSSLLINGKPEIQFLIERIKKELPEADIVIATTTMEQDFVIFDFAMTNKIKVVRGEYDEILERLKKACELLEGETIIRVFGNYPLLDIQQLKILYNSHKEKNYDYSFNEHSEGLLWGTGCEIFEKSFINRLSNEKLTFDQQASLSFYIRQNTEQYIINKLSCMLRREQFRLTLETEKDHEVIAELATNLTEITNDNIQKYLDEHKTLKRYNVEVPSREVGLDKLYLHPEKISSILKGGLDTSYPISVELTLTNVCNLECVYCSDRELRRRQGEEVSFEPEQLEKLFCELSKGGTKGITFEGGGEPTLYKYFNRVIVACKNAGLAAGLITNGTVKLSKNILKEFEWIRVSLDATTADEYKNLKGRDFFERVMNNIAYYSKYCKTVGVGFVVTKNNISKIEPLVMRLREIGASYIQMRPVVDCEELYPNGIDLSYLRFYQTKKFGVLVEGMTENSECGNHNLPCMANGLTSIISGDGAVFLCGRLNIYDWINPIGNIKVNSFENIWKGEERKLQWETVQNAQFCSEYCPQCRISKYNELMNKVVNIKSKNFI